MKVNDILHGFEIVRMRESAELNGILWEMRHLKTGAQLVWLDNNDTNKVFSIGFKTLPHDDTGVFHILEHSVLCGSDNFPVKEPFLDLLKSSMNTFLNAMTFSDKTIYPVSSRNEQDYLNLTRVYLDAVFHPAIYKNPSIFHQEGWHYELAEKDAEPTYKGVVFNEMKGAMSSVDRQIDYGICRMLFPDNCYHCVSGGDPKHIPELTYEQFIDSHRKFYNPTNAKIYLDGAVPLDKVLRLISDEYLDKFERCDVKHEIELQKPINACSKVQYYAIGKDESEENKAQMVYGKVLSHWSDRKKNMALSVLGSYLTATNESPLKRAILESGLAQDMSMYIDDSVLQPYSVLHIRNTEYEHRDALRKIIRDTTSRIVEEGIEKEELTAILSQYEFALREEQEPKGIIRNINALNSWLHDGDPMLYLENNSVLDALRQEVGTGYYEALLRELLLDDEGLAELYLLPSKTKGDEDMAEEQEKLSQAQLSWTEQDKEDILALNVKLEKWQCSEDSPEALATLPMLSLSDVSDTPEWVETVKSYADGVEILHHPVASNGVVHCNLYFSVADQSVENLQWLSFIAGLLGELPTASHSAAELQRLIKLYIGKLSFNVKNCFVKGDTDACKPYFVASFSILENYVKEGTALVCEILSETVCSDSAKVRELLLQSIEEYNQRFITEGHSFALKRAQSAFSASALLSEKVGGFDYFRFIKGMADSFDEKFSALCVFFQTAKDEIFRSHRLTLSETSLNPHSELLYVIEALKGNSERITSDVMKLQPEMKAKKEAVYIPSGVSYAVSCGTLSRYGEEYGDSLPVLSTILSFGYLWNEIRVRGGAYGCGFRARESGEMFFYSYRDPSPLRSLQIYRETAQFIRGFVQSDEAIDKYIISTISSMEPLMTPSERGALADTNFLCGVSFEDKLKIRQQMLSLKKEDLLSLCELFDKMAEGNGICVVGSEAAMQDAGEGWTKFSL